MDETRDLAPDATADQPERAVPEVDLERLIWDPEYREAMRPWLADGR